VNHHEIYTWENEIAARGDRERWCACYGEYDAGKRIYTGQTEALAVHALLEDRETQDGRIRGA
jgi:hypothetical protein